MRLIAPHIAIVILILGIAAGVGVLTRSVLGASIPAFFAVFPVWVACVRLIEYNRLSKKFGSFLHGRILQGSFLETMDYMLRRIIGPAEMMLHMQYHGHSLGHRRVFAHVYASKMPDAYPWKARIQRAYSTWDKNMLFKMRQRSWRDFFIPQF